MALDHIKNIRSLLIKSGFQDQANIIPLPSSGSNRIYYRVIFATNEANNSIIASFNNDICENIAYNSFTIHFKSMGLSVPDIFSHDSTFKYFLIQDLGDTTLFSLLDTNRKKAISLYKNVISDLLDFQINGIKNLDLDVAYPVKEFNTRSIMWDLNYFKYYFVRPSNIEFNEDHLEDDFGKLSKKLMNSENDFFNYRDFQSRNIMVQDDKLWYIDFQGGRKGPLQYDLVSLLYQVKANLSDSEKDILYSYYIDKLNSILPGKQKAFEEYYIYFVYFRLMQVMGAYGFRGNVQRKAHFLQSIPMAILSLRKILNDTPLDGGLPELNKVLRKVSLMKYELQDPYNNQLVIEVNSFSFKKKGVPVDTTGNGGGHVFDCRSLPNPGRLSELRDFTGLDSQIIEYLEDQEEISAFIENVKRIIDPNIENYIMRGFKNLQVNFGCTGGRHRSVYSASTIGKYIEKKYPQVMIIVNHNEL